MPTKARNKTRFVASIDDLQTTKLCPTCIHKFSNHQGCAAFPQGIPMPILLNKHDHHYPFEGDSGVTYEPKNR